MTQMIDDIIQLLDETVEDLKKEKNELEEAYFEYKRSNVFDRLKPIRIGNASDNVIRRCNKYLEHMDKVIKVLSYLIQDLDMKVR